MGMNETLEKKDFDVQMNAIELRFSGLETRFAKLEGRFAKLEGRFDKLEGRFDKLETRIDGLESGLIRLETEFKTEMNHVATKAWVLGGLAGGMGIAATIAVTFVKLFAV